MSYSNNIFKMLTIGIISRDINISNKFLNDIFIQESKNNNVIEFIENLLILKDGNVFISLCFPVEFPYNFDQIFLEDGFIGQVDEEISIREILFYTCVPEKFRIQYFGGK